MATRFFALFRFALAALAVISSPTARAQSGTWQPTGPTGGSVLSISAGEGGTAYACAYPYALYRTDDTGRTWQSIAFEGSWSGPDIVLALKSGTLLVHGHFLIERSTDGGATWEGVGNWSVTAMLEVAPGVVLASSYQGGILRSTDDGQTWAFSNSGLVDLNLVSLAADKAGTIYAATNNAPSTVHISRDLGLTWSTTQAPPPIDYLGCVSVETSGTLLVGSWYAQIARSTDGGGAWTVVFDGTNNPSIPSVNQFASCDNGNVFAATSQGCLRSTDDGASWQVVSALKDLQLTGIIRNTGTVLIASSWDMGFFRSTDSGASWEPSNGEFRKYSAWHLATTAGYVMAATTMGMFKSTDDGDSWTPVPGFYPDQVNSICEGPSGSIYVTTNDGYIHRTTNGGTDWSKSSVDLGNSSLGAICMGSDSNMYVGLGSGMLRSTDDGVTWESFGEVGSGTHSLASGEGWLYAGAYPGVYRTQFPDTQWTLQLSVNGYVEGISVSPAGEVLAATEYGLYRSADHGVTWGIVDGLPAGWYDCIVTPTKSNFFLAGVSISGLGAGAYESYNAAATWNPINDGLGTARLFCLGVTGGGTLLGGSGTLGLFRYSGNALDVTPEARSVPERLSLSQNYPNPFNPTTGIRYQVSGVSDVRLVVCDLLGREVAVLVNERKAPGSYEVTFNAAGRASGVYFCRLTAGNCVETRKMLLLQ